MQYAPWQDNVILGYGEPSYACANPACDQAAWEEEDYRKCETCGKGFCAECLVALSGVAFCAACSASMICFEVQTYSLELDDAHGNCSPVANRPRRYLYACDALAAAASGGLAVSVLMIVPGQQPERLRVARFDFGRENDCGHWDHGDMFLRACLLPSERE